MMFDPDSLTPEEQPCVGPYMTFKQSSPNLRGNLIVNLAADIGVMDDDKVRTLLSTPCIDMSLPGKQPCAYFCIFLTAMTPINSSCPCSSPCCSLPLSTTRIITARTVSSMSLLISCWTSFRPSARFRILTEKWRRFESVP